jgi:hypothetical protein
MKRNKGNPIKGASWVSRELPGYQGASWVSRSFLGIKGEVHRRFRGEKKVILFRIYGSQFSF